MGAILLVSRTGSANASMASGTEFTAITAAVLGGVAFFEGGNIKAGDAEAIQWIEAIQKDKDPLVLPEQALVVTQILEAIYKSAETGLPVVL